MKIFVKVKPRSKKESVEMIDDKHFVVAVKEPPIEGRANLAVIRALAEYFRIAAWRVEIVAGHTANQKTIEII